MLHLTAIGQAENVSAALFNCVMWPSSVTERDTSSVCEEAQQTGPAVVVLI